MNDPVPENIAGEKRVVHRVNHEVNWGHVAVAVVALCVLYKASEWAESRSAEEPSEDDNGVHIDIEGAAEAAAGLA